MYQDNPLLETCDFGFMSELNVTEVVTQLLENNLTHLESLRAGLERTSNKDIGDVRQFGDTMAASLLVGVEQTVDYGDLLRVIAEFKNGIASRRVAAA